MNRQRIFMAHALEDKPQIIGLYSQLKKAGFDPWLDEHDLLPGQIWKDEISRAIAAASVFLACLSTRSVNKVGYVQNEFRRALATFAERPPGSIYLIPVRLDECVVPDIRIASLELSLKDIQRVDLFAVNGFERLSLAIEQANKANPTRDTKVFDSTPTHTPQTKGSRLRELREDAPDTSEKPNRSRAALSETKPRKTIDQQKASYSNPKTYSNEVRSISPKSGVQKSHEAQSKNKPSRFRLIFFRASVLISISLLIVFNYWPSREIDEKDDSPNKNQLIIDESIKSSLESDDSSLIIEDVTYYWSIFDSEEILIIKGQIRNVTDKKKAIPPIQISVTNKLNKEVYNEHLKLGWISPNKRISFEKRLALNKSMAKSLYLSFDEDSSS